MSLLRIYLEELRSTHRGRFTLLGAFALTVFVALLATTVGTGAPYRTEFLVPVYLVATMLFVPITAVSIARPRGAHFLEGVFTAPVTAHQYLLAKWAWAVTIGAAFLAATMPFAVLQTMHVGFVPLTWTFVAVGVCAVVYACSLGLLIGVLVVGRSIVPTITVATTAMIVLVAALVFLRPVHGMDPGPTRDALLALVHASGPVLLHDAFGLPPIRSQEPLASASAFIIQVVGFLAAATWTFGRAQSAQTWERRLPILTLASIACLLVGAPAAIAGDTYEAVPDNHHDPGSRSNNVTVRLTTPSNEPPRPEMFPPRAILTSDTSNERVLWIYLYAGPGFEQPFTDIRLDLSAKNMVVDPTSLRVPEPGLLPMAPAHEGRSPQPYLRVPITLTTPAPELLGENVHVLEVRLSYHAQGSPAARDGDASLGLHSEVKHIQEQVATTMGLPSFALLLGFGLRRWRMR